MQQPGQSGKSGLDLAEGFAGGGEAAWRMLVEKALKRAYPSGLESRTLDGIVIAPLYTAFDGEDGLPGAFPGWRGGRAAGAVAGGWDIRQRHDHPDPIAANRAILEDLAGGVRSLALRLDTAFAQGEDEPDGIMAYDTQGLATVLDGVLLDVAPVQLEAPGREVEAAEMLLELLAEAPAGVRSVAHDLGLDPLGAVAVGRADPERAVAPVLELVHRVIEPWPRLGLLHVDGELYHAAGASEAQELAAAIATGIAYLREADAAGLMPELIAPRIGFTLAADADIFLTIAKCRAARRLWAEVCDGCGVPDQPMRLSVRTASRMQTRRDSHVNMLRTTAAAFAGAVGGAEAITVLPFDSALGEGTRLGRRIARNIQLILAEESQLFRVIDPAGGSYHVEALSRELAGRAWSLVQAIEGEGGMMVALRQGVVQDAIAEAYVARLHDLAHRRQAITGVSTYPDLDERRPEQTMLDLAPLAAAAGAVLGERRRPASIRAPLRPMRLAEGFERLRDLSDLALARTGSRPRVFVVALGPLAQHAAELDWLQNAFAAGGIETVVAPAGAAPAAIGPAFRDSGTPLACLCGIDRDKPAMAAPFVEAVLASRAAALYAAGPPDAALEGLGIDGFVAVGGNLLGLLEDIHSLLLGEWS